MENAKIKNSKVLYMTYVVNSNKKIVKILLSYEDFQRIDKKKFPKSQYDEFWRKLEITPP